jgi:hypothetical protein
VSESSSGEVAASTCRADRFCSHRVPCCLTPFVASSVSRDACDDAEAANAAVLFGAEDAAETKPATFGKGAELETAAAHASGAAASLAWPDSRSRFEGGEGAAAPSLMLLLIVWPLLLHVMSPSAVCLRLA